MITVTIVESSVDDDCHGMAVDNSIIHHLNPDLSMGKASEIQDLFNVMVHFLKALVAVTCVKTHAMSSTSENNEES